MPQNSFYLVESIKLIRTKLRAIISTKTFYLLPCLFLNHCLPLFECREHITLLLQEEHLHFSGKTINDHQHIISTSLRRHPRRTPEIRIYIIKCSLCTVNTFGEFDSLLLPKNAMLIKLQLTSTLLIKKSSPTQFSHPILTHMPQTHML